MCRRSRLIFVDLHKDHMSRFFTIMQHVESDDPVLLATVPGVFLSRIEKALKLIRHDSDIDMDDKQAIGHEPDDIRRPPPPRYCPSVRPRLFALINIRMAR